MASDNKGCLTNRNIIMANDLFLANTKLIESVTSSISRLQKGQGSVIAVEGDSGFGKTAFLRHIQNLSLKDSSLLTTYSRTAEPIGKVKVSNLQPLFPFTKAIEALIDNPNNSAEKKFAMNIGITALTAVPFVGDVFYAIKEIGRDWREFKRDKSSADRKDLSSAAADYYDTLNAYCDKAPVVLLLDDMDMADVQSIELMNLIASNINSIRMLLVFTYSKSKAEGNNMPFVNFLNMNKSLISERLEALDKKSVSRLSETILPNYIKSDEFENWLLKETSGLPKALVEYLKYFSTNTPFDSDGNFEQAKMRNDILPSSIQAVISKNLEFLSEDDKNTLAVCSSEGIEFTVSIVSELLNTDLLTTIKKLRAIQNRTGIINSIGASYKYGEKSTIYKFSQSYYHSYFEKSLEYEEYVALHGRIKEILKRRFDQAKISEIKEQIAPYLAAHSSESGDTETAESMMIVSAESAQKYGSQDFIYNLFNDYQMVAGVQSNTETIEENTNFGKILSSFDNFSPKSISNVEFSNVGVENLSKVEFDFKFHFSNALEMFLDDKYNDLIKYLEDLKISCKESLKRDDINKIDILLAQANIGIGDTKNASNILSNLEEESKRSDDREFICQYYNLRAIYEANHNSNLESANYYLNLAAQISIDLPSEMKLLTLSSIIAVVSKNSPSNAAKYFNVAKKLAYDLNMPAYLQDLEDILKH